MVRPQCKTSCMVLVNPKSWFRSYQSGLPYHAPIQTSANLLSIRIPRMELHRERARKASDRSVHPKDTCDPKPMSTEALARQG